MENVEVLDISNELSEAMTQIEQALQDHTQGIIRGLDEDTESLVRSMKEEHVLRYLEDSMADNQPQRALQLLHSMR